MSLIIPNSGDTSGGKYEALDQAEPDSLDIEILSVAGSGVVSGCAVTSNDSATDVSVANGVIILNGTPYVLVGGVTGLPSSPADNRFDIVVARVTSGVASVVVIPGVESSTNPTFPKSASVITGAVDPSANVDFSTDVVLGSVYRTGSGTVTASRIVDKRVVRTISIFNQGVTAPSTGSGDGTGSLYFQSTGVPVGTASGVYVKKSDGTWVGLAQDVGAHFPIGAVAAWPSKAPVPSGCLELNGQGLATSSYPALFGIYGYDHGGSSGTFLLPDWNGKSLRGTTSTPLIGTTVGADTFSLTEAMLPAHKHTILHSHTFNHSHGIDHTHSSATITLSAAPNHVHVPGDGQTYFVTQSLGGPNAFNINAGTGALIGTGASQTSNAGAHTHSVTAFSSSFSGSTSSISTITTPSPFASNFTDGGNNATGPGNGTGASISRVPLSAYTRWIVRASLGADPSFTGGSSGLQGVSNQSADFTLQQFDAGTLISLTGPLFITIPEDASLDVPIGTHVDFWLVSGTATFQTSGSAVIESESSLLAIATAHTAATVIKRAANTWSLVGKLS